jgi:hypothetical protein
MVLHLLPEKIGERPVCPQVFPVCPQVFPDSDERCAARDNTDDAGDKEDCDKSGKFRRGHVVHLIKAASYLPFDGLRSGNSGSHELR